jgi:hypothetical protein
MTSADEHKVRGSMLCALRIDVLACMCVGVGCVPEFGTIAQTWLAGHLGGSREKQWVTSASHSHQLPEQSRMGGRRSAPTRDDTSHARSPTHLRRRSNLVLQWARFISSHETDRRVGAAKPALSGVDVASDKRLGKGCSLTCFPRGRQHSSAPAPLTAQAQGWRVSRVLCSSLHLLASDGYYWGSFSTQSYRLLSLLGLAVALESHSSCILERAWSPVRQTANHHRLPNRCVGGCAAFAKGLVLYGQTESCWC